MSLPPELRDRVLASVQKTPPAPTRAEVSRTTGMLLLTALMASLVAFFSLGGFRLAGRPLGFVVAVAIGWGVTAVVCTRLTLVRGRSMLGVSRQSLVLIALLTAPILFAWAVMWTMPWPEIRDVDTTWSGHFKCFSFTAIMGLLPLIPLALTRRGTDPVHPRATGAAMGAAMGAWAGMLIDLHCSCTSLTHMAFSHVLPTIVLAMLGALVGPRILGLDSK